MPEPIRARTCRCACLTPGCGGSLHSLLEMWCGLPKSIGAAAIASTRRPAIRPGQGRGKVGSEGPWRGPLHVLFRYGFSGGLVPQRPTASHRDRSALRAIARVVLTTPGAASVVPQLAVLLRWCE